MFSFTKNKAKALPRARRRGGAGLAGLALSAAVIQVLRLPSREAVADRSGPIQLEEPSQALVDLIHECTGERAHELVEVGLVDGRHL